MKKTTIENLLAHIKGMDHRERIVFTLPNESRAKCGNDSYSLEIYVTFPFEQSKMNGEDQFRVLFQVVTCDGKHRKGFAKVSCKRADLRTDRGTLKMAFGLI